VKTVNSWVITRLVAHYWYEIKLVIDLILSLMFQIFTFFLLAEEVVSCCGYMERVKFLFIHLQVSSATIVAFLVEKTFHCTATSVAIQVLCCFSSVFHLFFQCNMLYFIIIFEYSENIILKSTTIMLAYIRTECYS